MPSLLFTPGPLHHFVSFPQGSSIGIGPFYLGTCVLAPKPSAEKFKIPVLNDLGGRSVPFQLVKDGEEWMVMSTLNRFDLNVARAIRAIDGGGAAVGSESGYARGTLVIGVSDFQLCILNGYAGNVAAGGAAAQGILNAGRTFLSATTVKYEESTEGTRVLELAFAFKCENVFNPVTRGFSCYTEVIPNAAALAALIT